MRCGEWLLAPGSCKARESTEGEVPHTAPWVPLGVGGALAEDLPGQPRAQVRECPRPPVPERPGAVVLATGVRGAEPPARGHKEPLLPGSALPGAHVAIWLCCARPQAPTSREGLGSGMGHTTGNSVREAPRRALAGSAGSWEG